MLSMDNSWDTQMEKFEAPFNAFIIILFYVFTYITYMTNWDT
jgi:hypothetical protein